MKTAEQLKDRVNFSFAQVWNDSLDQFEPWEAKPRNYMWASELGGAYIDRFLKMSGEEITNPPDARARRKMESGNFWENIIGTVLMRAGIMKGSQDRVKFALNDDVLPVSGKLDFLVGGQVDQKQAAKYMNFLQEVELFPDKYMSAMDSVISYFLQKYPQGIPDIVLEIKSTSDYLFEIRYNSGIADKSHILQCYHYMKALGVSEGKIVYICREDARLFEYPIFLNDPEIEAMYVEDITTMSNYYNNNEKPPREDQVIFDAERNRFTTNWRVPYSSYLTKIYGYKHQSEFDDKWRSKVASWNRVWTRIMKGEKMTPSNLSYIEEMKAKFPNFDNLVDEMRKSSVELHEDAYQIDFESFIRD